jgi:hypothetical protein
MRRNNGASKQRSTMPLIKSSVLDQPNAHLRVQAPLAESARLPRSNWSLPLTADGGIPQGPNPAGVPSQAECPEAAQGKGRSRRDRSLSAPECSLGRRVAALPLSRCLRIAGDPTRRSDAMVSFAEVANNSIQSRCAVCREGECAVPRPGETCPILARQRSEPIAHRPAALAPSAASAWLFPHRDRRVG